MTATSPDINTVDDLVPLLDQLRVVVAELRAVAERMKEEPEDE